MKKLLYIFMTFILISVSTGATFAASGYDERIPKPTNVNLGSDGSVSWQIASETIDPYTGVTYQLIYKKFEVQLMKRYYNQVNNTYEYKDSGSTKTITVESDTDYYEGEIEITSAGYYKAKVRAYTVEGTYGPYSDVRVDDTDAAAFDESDVVNVNLNTNTQANYIYGPGTVDYSGAINSNMQVQSPFYNIYQQQQYLGYSPVINGAGGLYSVDMTRNVSANVIAGATVGIGPGVNNTNQYSQNVSQPGFVNENNMTLTPNSPMIVNNVPNVNSSLSTYQIVQSGPSITAANVSSEGSPIIGSMPGYNNTTSINTNTSPSATQNTQMGYYSTEVGWHNDNYGRYYYLGNGTYLKNQWYLIDNSYYRFDENGYMIAGRWFKDPSNQGWYYMNDDGRMATGWKLYNGVWYYLNPQKGTYYGVMYANCSLPIDGKYYAFNAEGGCIMNNWYDGHYYGADCARVY